MVSIEAIAGGPPPAAFRRLDRVAFQVAISDTFEDDTDGDMLPDPWEVHYGTQLGVDDADCDPDGADDTKFTAGKIKASWETKTRDQTLEVEWTGCGTYNVLLDAEVIGDQDGLTS